jgi:hypothetical protein
MGIPHRTCDQDAARRRIFYDFAASIVRARLIVFQSDPGQHQTIIYTHLSTDPPAHHPICSPTQSPTHSPSYKERKVNGWTSARLRARVLVSYITVTPGSGHIWKALPSDRREALLFGVYFWHSFSHSPLPIFGPLLQNSAIHLAPILIKCCSNSTLFFKTLLLNVFSVVIPQVFIRKIAVNHCFTTVKLWFVQNHPSRKLWCFWLFCALVVHQFNDISAI